jgi:oxaloacetate decarboxylase alpha subunit
MSQIKFIDTTLRDGQQSLWALNMTTEMMLPALEQMDRAGFEAMEFFVPIVQLKKMVRDLNENPWEWLRQGAAIAEKTPLRLHAGYKGGLGKVPESVKKLMVQKVIDHGITCARISSPWNNFDELREEVDELKKMGMDSVVNIIYSVSPRHTDDYFVERARAAAGLKPYRLCFKDVGGLLTPERVRELLPKIQSVIGDIVLELHVHCNNGLAPVNVMEAVKLGITHVHTAVPPLANGSSNPSIYNTASNLRALGHEITVSEELLKPVEAHFMAIAKREGFAIGTPNEYDETLYSHQVPGGMISNLKYQLAKVGMIGHLDATLEEAARVRADFGYPIMVTPLSQFVGTQAAINVMTGARYEQVSDESIYYALGHFGQEAIDVMDPAVKDKILSRKRAKELAQLEFPELSLNEVRQKYGESLTDEELILRSFVDEKAVEVARHSRAAKNAGLSSSQPIVELVRSLLKMKDKSFVSVQHGQNLSLVIKKSQQN